MANLSQNTKVLNHLKNIGPITSMVAFNKYGITRLAARIRDLRDKGYSINSTLIKASDSSFGRHAEYTIFEEGNSNVNV